jgi:hypothetical protein
MENCVGPKDGVLILGCRLVLTSFACPEQYDVFEESTQQQIGYLRLRHGYFRADYLECGGETVYEAQTKGDGLFDDDEREQHLNAAITALRKHHEQQ